MVFVVFPTEPLEEYLSRVLGKFTRSTCGGRCGHQGTDE